MLVLVHHVNIAVGTVFKARDVRTVASKALNNVRFPTLINQNLKLEYPTQMHVLFYLLAFIKNNIAVHTMLFHSLLL